MRAYMTSAMPYLGITSRPLAALCQRDTTRALWHAAEYREERYGAIARTRHRLDDCIEPSMDSREFFLRKAIGWTLRQYARTDPREVLRDVRTHRARLSPLSKREALNASLRGGTRTAVP
jgi:hypothetical protein